MNLLIALMGHTYERVQEDAIGQYYLERGRVIVEMMTDGHKARLGSMIAFVLHPTESQQRSDGFGADDGLGAATTSDLDLSTLRGSLTEAGASGRQQRELQDMRKQIQCLQDAQQSQADKKNTQLLPSPNSCGTM
jgi:hypothetical protein